MTSRFGSSFQRFLHNFAAHSFGQVVNIISQIFAVPLFLHFWSKQEYGEWIVLTSVPSLLWTLDNGLSGLAGSRMTVMTGRGDWTTANQIFRNVMFVQNLLSIVLFSMTALIVLKFNISKIFGFSHLAPSESGTILLLMIAYMVLGFCIGQLKAAYRASALEARGVLMSNLWRLSDFGAVLFVLPFGGHPVALACGMIVSISTWTAVMFLDVRRKCSNVEFAMFPLSTTQLRATMVDGLPILAGEAAGAFFLQGYPLLVNSFLGPSAVVTLTTIRTASRTMFQGVQMVGNATGSELSRTYGNQDWEGYLRLVKVLLVATIWAAAGACIGLTLFGPWAIATWTWGKVEVSHSIMFLFALSVACQAGWNACGSVLISTNMHHQFNYAYLGLTIMGLCLVGFFERAFGFTGVPLTMVIVDGLLLTWALHICRTKLTFISLRSLAVVFQPSFYRRKAGMVLKRFVHAPLTPPRQP